MKANAPALYSFTEEFWQEWDHREATSANDVLLRWRSDRFAVLAAIWQHRDLLTGKDVIFFRDNEAAASAMIKGDSRLPAVGTMAMCVQLLLIRYKMAIWFEWVHSNSNLADGLSRDGAEDPWTLDQHWELPEFQGLLFAVSRLAARTILSRVC